MTPRARRLLGVLALALALGLVPWSGALAQGSFPATLGASTPEFQDDISVPGQWGLADAHGSTTDADGELEMTFDSAGWMWGWRDLAAAHHPVVRIEGSVAIDGAEASGGWMCGATDSLFAFGIVDAAGDWRIGHITEGEVTVDLEGSAQDGFEQGDIVSVECGQENVDVTRLLLRIDGVSVGTADVGPLGPFDRVATVGASDDGSGTVRFDDTAAWTGARYAPTDEPPSTPGPASTAPVVDSVLGADTVAFTDDFSTPDLWGTGSRPEGFVTYDAEQLAITVLSDASTRWSWRSMDDAAPVMRIEGSVSMNGEGSAGWMCGDAASDPDFLFGLIDGSGRWSVGRIVAGAIEVIERGTVPAGPPGTSPHDVVVECGDTTGGEGRVLLWVDGEPMADLAVDAAVGPFQKATAAAGAASSMPYNARFDDVTVSFGTHEAPAS